jgi:hypothetical protein
MPDTPVDLRVPTVRTEAPIYCCPECGSFLDAPRVNPDDGELGRKCSSCREWHPLAAEYFRHWT